MNRSNQTQVINLPVELALKRDYRPLPSIIDDIDLGFIHTDAGPAVNTKKTNLLYGLAKEEPEVPQSQIYKKQAIKMEEMKPNVYNIDEKERISLPFLDEDLQIPEAVKPLNLGLPTDVASIKVMKIEDIKKQFYNENQECLLCGFEIIRPFKGHIQAHIKKQKAFEADYILKPKGNGDPFQIKCKTCSKIFTWIDGEKRLHDHSVVCKAKTSNLNKRVNGNALDISYETLEKKLKDLNKRVYDNTPDISYEALEKKLKGEINTLKNKLTTLETKLAMTEKKVTGVYRTQGAMKKRLDIAEQQVEKVEQNLKTVEEKVDNHEDVLVKLLNHLIQQGQFEKPKDSNVFDQLASVKDYSKERDWKKSRERSCERKAKQESRRPPTRDKSEERREIRQNDRERYSGQTKRRGKIFGSGFSDEDDM